MTNYSTLRNQRRAQLHGIYVITDERVGADISPTNHARIARAAIDGGASILQLRGKRTPAPQLFEIALQLRELTSKSGTLLVINDDPQLALAVDADGVHLGPDDATLLRARAVLGVDRIIGISCGDEKEAITAFENGADYIGAGAIFATATKLDAGAPIGLEALRDVVAATPLPVAAIGGVEVQNIASLRICGAAMACVISAVTRHEDEAGMSEATRVLLNTFREGKV